VQPAVTAILVLGLVCAGRVTAIAQRTTPVAVTSRTRDADARPVGQAWRMERERPRARVVAPLAVVFGVAGGVAGYYASEESCADRSECWDHFAYVPLGYTAGVAVGAGIAGVSERCPTGLLRATGGALLGLVAGAATVLVLDALAIVAAPVAPIVGATWLVTSCRIHPRSAPPGGR
jgi:hypothetical protein